VILAAQRQTQERTMYNWLSPVILYIDPATPVGEAVHVDSTACHTSPWRECTMPIAVVRGTEHSDYSGCARQASNHRMLLELCAEEPYGGEADTYAHVYPLIGSHGYQAIAYPAYLGPVPLCESLAEIIEVLADGEALDEDDELELEAELEAEAWEDHGRKDFVKVLTSLLDEADPAHDHCLDEQLNEESAVDDPIDEIWHAGCATFNINGGSGCTVETGCLVHFYISEWEHKAREYMHNTSRGGKAVALMAELAIATRSGARS
jgi:hypothetical protein